MCLSGQRCYKIKKIDTMKGRTRQHAGGGSTLKQKFKISDDTNLHEQELLLFGQRQRRGGASFRRADTAQVCSNVGFVEVDGPCECSAATAARQIVSERW